MSEHKEILSNQNAVFPVFCLPRVSKINGAKKSRNVIGSFFTFVFKISSIRTGVLHGLIYLFGASSGKGFGSMFLVFLKDKE